METMLQIREWWTIHKHKPTGREGEGGREETGAVMMMTDRVQASCVDYSI